MEEHLPEDGRCKRRLTMAVREKQLQSRNQNNWIIQKQERNLIPSMIPSTIPTMMRKAMAIVASEDLPSAGAALGQSLPILIGLARKKCKNPFDGVARNQASRQEEDHRFMGVQ